MTIQNYDRHADLSDHFRSSRASTPTTNRFLISAVARGQARAVCHRSRHRGRRRIPVTIADTDSKPVPSRSSQEVGRTSKFLASGSIRT
jgi:hypothetical protein